MLLPDQLSATPRLMGQAGKSQTIYLINRDNMGHFNPNNDNQIVQTLPYIFPNGTTQPGNFSAPVYYNGVVYFGPVNDSVKAFQMTNGLLSAAPTSVSAETYGFPGGTLAISANGNTDGILWVTERKDDFVTDTVHTNPGALRAYDPANLGIELYNSNQAGTRDTMDFAAKYNIPLVVNGKVYVASVSKLTVYGLLP